MQQKDQRCCRVASLVIADAVNGKRFGIHRYSEQKELRGERQAHRGSGGSGRGLVDEAFAPQVVP